MRKYPHFTTKSIIGLLLFASLTVGWAAPTTLTSKVIGITGPALKNTEARLAIAQSSYGDELTPRSVELFYKNAPKNIRAAIEPFGFFQSHIYPSLSQNGDAWTAIFVIEPGEPLRVTSLNISLGGPGDDNPALKKLLDQFPIKIGQIFDAEKYTKAKQQLFQTANEEGYLKASFTEKAVKIDLKHKSLAMLLHLDTGPRFYFGPVTFNQNTFDNHFLQRFLSFQEGQPFSSPQLVKFQQNLSNSNYFQDVNVNPDLEHTLDNIVPVNVGLVANKSKQYNIGLGYGTFTGARFTATSNFRHLTNTGHHANVQLKLSQILSGLAAQYVIPGENPLTDQYTIGANAQKFVPKNGNSISESISLGYVKSFHEWKNTAKLNYLHEKYNITGNPSRNSRILYPSLEVLRIKADDLLYTRNGTKFDFIIKGAKTVLLSNVSFIQSELDTKFIFSPSEASRIIMRADLGYTIVKDLNLLPISLQFYAGGLDSVRGFPYSYFGPGRYLKTASVEIQHRIKGHINGAIFYDVGTADNHINAPIGRGTGIGVIYVSAIGPIKAYASIGRLAQKPRHFSLDFSLGPDL